MLAAPAATSVSLVGCAVRIYANGSLTPTSTITLTQTVAARDVLVVCNSSASAPVLAQCDVATGSVNWNGDDAVELFCSGVSVDNLGQIGVDPGLEWGAGLTSTADNTLRRPCTITSGDVVGDDAFDPATEWDGLAGDIFDNLGSYHCP